MGKSITDLSSVTTVGLDLAKHVFQVHAIGAFSSSPSYRSVLSVWKPAVRPIIGRVS